MSTRIEDILVRVRDSLSDEDKSRWTDARLLRLIDECQKKIATKAQLLRRKAYVSAIAGVSEYILPSDAFLLTRVVNQYGKEITIKSHDEMDDLKGAWEFDTGSQIEYIVFDKQEPGRIKTYPILTSVEGGEIFTVPDLGVLTAVEGDTINYDFGVTVDVSHTGTETVQFTSIYGVVIGMAEVEEVFAVYYRGKPAEVNATSDLLEIDDKWDAAIKHYVLGMALHDNQDTQNRMVSRDELDLYGLEFADAKRVSSKDHVSSSVYRTSYNSEI